MARLVKKTLFVGAFAYLIGNWNNLARIVFESFAGLGLKASGTGFTTAQLLQPGQVAQTGLDAGRPLLASISNLMGYWSFFENFIQIACMFFAWALVLLAFFILAVQLFVTLIEFKLTTLAGFVLIPFGLFGKKRVHGRTRARQCDLIRHQGAGARHHHRHRLDAYSPSSRPVSAAPSRRSTKRWRSFSQRCRCSASASSVLASPMASSPEAHNLAPAPPWGPALPQAAWRSQAEPQSELPLAASARLPEARRRQRVAGPRSQVEPPPHTASEQPANLEPPASLPASAMSRVPAHKLPPLR